MEEPMDHSGIMNDMMSSPDSMAVPKAYDYSTIVADRLNKPFDYKNAHCQPAIQLNKKSYEEILAQLEEISDESDDDDDELIELHASVGERSMKLMTNVPIVRAFNMAENSLERTEATKEETTNVVKMQ